MKNDKCLLSIVIVTMNRAQALKRALISCTNSTLPDNTEFIIIDNASTDETKNVVKECLKSNDYKYIYLDKNIGCAPARNVGFENAKGSFLYFMDDDLYIPSDICNTFFIDMIALLSKETDLSVLTNNIYDETYKMNLKLVRSKEDENGIAESFVYHGGSHFLRKEDFFSPLYPAIPFGVEELVLALNIHNRKKRIVCNCNYTALHQPNYIAFDNNDYSYRKRVALAIANGYAIKKSMYPLLFVPLVWMFYFLKKVKYRLSKQEKKELALQIKKTEQLLQKGRISLFTTLSLIKLYGLSIFV